MEMLKELGHRMPKDEQEYDGLRRPHPHPPAARRPKTVNSMSLSDAVPRAEQHSHAGGASAPAFAFREQVRHSSYERQPHIFGAQPGMYSEGTAVENYRDPPKWWPGKMQ